MQAVLNTHFHLHRYHLFRLLQLIMILHYRKVKFFSDGSFYIPVHNHPDKVPYTPSNPIESLILLLEVWELEFECFVLGEEPCWLQFFGEGVKFRT